MELEAAEYEDSGGLNNKASVLTIGTPLMPYTEPTFANEGKVERLIEEKVKNYTNRPPDSKKRSRREFEAINSKPLLSPCDQLENTEASSETKSKFNKCVLVKQISTKSSQSLS